MIAPEGTPDFVVEAYEDISRAALSKLKNDENKVFAAGYMSCVSDFGEILEAKYVEDKDRREAQQQEHLKSVRGFGG